VKTTDTRGISHVSKRILKGLKRQKVGEELLSIKAANWRYKATNVMEI